MTYLNIKKFILINQLEKDHSMIEMNRLKNIVIFIQTFLKHFSQLIINILLPRVHQKVMHA